MIFELVEKNKNNLTKSYWNIIEHMQKGFHLEEEMHNIYSIEQFIVLASKYAQHFYKELTNTTNAYLFEKNTTNDVSLALTYHLHKVMDLFYSEVISGKFTYSVPPPKEPFLATNFILSEDGRDYLFEKIFFNCFPQLREQNLYSYGRQHDPVYIEIFVSALQAVTNDLHIQTYINQKKLKM